MLKSGISAFNWAAPRPVRAVSVLCFITLNIQPMMSVITWKILFETPFLLFYVTEDLTRQRKLAATTLFE